MTDRVRVARALLSVSDKTGLVGLARELLDHGVELVSTGGTARTLGEAGLPVTDVAAVTGFPEIMGGRVKTLHPAIHGGLLARLGEAEDRAALDAHGIAPFDLLVANLYPFEAAVAAGAEPDETIEQIDIGGPALIRAAAKNHARVAVLTDPGQYAEFVAALSGAEAHTTLRLRRALAAAAFARTAAYDAAIAGWFGRALGERFPARLLLGGALRDMLRYGENPHQEGAFYTDGSCRKGIATSRQLQGKEVSYNNLNDADAALELVAEFDGPAIAIIKHANPCGVAEADDQAAAWRAALACDPVSAFGGVVAFNRPVEAATVRAIGDMFLEVIIAPAVTPEAHELLSRKRNLRVLVTGGMPDPASPGLHVRQVSGGFLVQDRDAARAEAAQFRVVTQRVPTESERADLVFAARVAKHVRSNAIVYARGRATVGIGAGQMSRVDSCRIAAWKAADIARAEGLPEPRTKGCVVASDAFFPFADGLLEAIAAGATAVVQPGGSVRDPDVIAAADAHGIAMVFTGIRHFRH